MNIRMIHNGRDRDSLLMPMDDRTVDLMLQYSVQLIRCEPTTRITEFRSVDTHASGNGIVRDGSDRFNLDAWTDGEWVAFRDNFVRVITRYWDGKFELTPNRAWYQARHAIGAPTASRITCSLSIGLVDAAGQANQRYFIIKPRETNFRSFAWAAHRLGMFTHRDLALDWNTRRTRLGRVRHSVSFLQTTILHEFGHTLGLHHVGGRGNADFELRNFAGAAQRAHGHGRPCDGEIGPALDYAAAPPSDTDPRRSSGALHAAGGRTAVDHVLGQRLGAAAAARALEGFDSINCAPAHSLAWPFPSFSPAIRSCSAG